MRSIGILGLLLACSHPKPAAAPVAKPAPPPVATTPEPVKPAGPPPRLWSDAEIAAVEADALARLGANAKRSCPAPNGTASGSSGPDIITLVEGTGALEGCIGRLRDAGKDGTLKPGLDGNKPDAVAIDKDCSELIAKTIHHASTFQEGCSPFQLGVRVEPVSLMAPIQIAHLLGYHARVAKDPVKQIGTLVDTLRVLQDLQRGHVTLVSAMVSVASTELVGERLDAILDTAKLSKTKLDELAGQLDRLIAAAPSFHEIVAGEREAQLLYFGLARFEPKDWTPPGGWNEELRHLGDDTGAKHVADPRDETMAIVTATAQSADARDKACPFDATLEACRSGLEQLGSVPPPPNLDPSELWKQGQTDQPGMRLKLRQQIVDILVAVASPSYATYVAKVMGAVSRLAELRVHVEVLRTHKCDTAKLAALSPASLGAPLVLAAGKGTLEVTAPAGAKSPWTMRCR